MLTGCQLKCCIETSDGKKTEVVNQTDGFETIKEGVKIRNIDIRVAAEMTKDKEKWR